MTKPSLPKKGMSPESVLEQLQSHRGEDVDWKSGKTFSLVYYAGEQVMQLLHDAYSMFMAENGLSPMAFPSLRQMENEIVGMTADMLHGGDAAGIRDAYEALSDTDRDCIVDFLKTLQVVEEDAPLERCDGQGGGATGGNVWITNGGELRLEPGVHTLLQDVERQGASRRWICTTWRCGAPAQCARRASRVSRQAAMPRPVSSVYRRLA